MKLTVEDHQQLSNMIPLDSEQFNEPPSSNADPIRANRAPNGQSLSRKNREREEIREYLSRLRQIVPGCPKDGRISRLDLIQHVIDYIVQLQHTLLNHPVNQLNQLQQSISSIEAASANSVISSSINSTNVSNNSRRMAIPTLLQLQTLTAAAANVQPQSMQQQQHQSAEILSQRDEETTRAVVQNQQSSVHSRLSSRRSRRAQNKDTKTKGSSCRRPLGVLATINQHRNL